MKTSYVNKKLTQHLVFKTFRVLFEDKSFLNLKSFSTLNVKFNKLILIQNKRLTSAPTKTSKCKILFYGAVLVKLIAFAMAL